MGGGHQSLQSCCQRDRSRILSKNLENMYKTKNAQEKIFLMWKLMNLKLKEGQSIVEHLNDFEGMIMQLLATGLSLNDETQACLLLNHYQTIGTLWWCLWEIQPHKEKSCWL